MVAQTSRANVHGTHHHPQHALVLQLIHPQALHTHIGHKPFYNQFHDREHGNVLVVTNMEDNSTRVKCYSTKQHAYFKLMEQVPLQCGIEKHGNDTFDQDTVVSSLVPQFDDKYAYIQIALAPIMQRVSYVERDHEFDASEAYYAEDQPPPTQ